MKNIKICVFRSVALTVAGILLCFNVYAKQDADSESTLTTAKVETLLSELNSPWSLAFLPDQGMLITELGGQLRQVQNGKLLVTPISGVPEVYYAGQGGLFDVVVDDDFTNNKRIFLSYAHGSRKGNATRLISARLIDNALQDVKVLFTAAPLKTTPHHYGGRVVQLNDGSLLVTVGDGFNYREQAQTLDNHLGKIVHISATGNAPANNPWLDTPAALADIWSRGHRNQQAIVATPDGRVYANEHGPQGGDEINLILPGKNYGWPVITQGIDYNGANITPYKKYAGMEQPMVDWTPSIAPSGMTFYTGSLFPQWQGDLIAVSLKERTVRRIDLEGTQVISDERILPEIKARMRDIRTGPDGALYILTDGEDGKLLRVTPK